MLLAYEVAEREADPVVSAAACSPPSSSAAGRPASRWRAPSPRSRTRRCRTSSSRFARPKRASCSRRRGRASSRRFPEQLRNAARKSLLTPRRRGAREDGRHAHRGRDACGSATSGSRPARSSGPPASAASPLGKTLGVPLDRAGRVLVQKDLTIPGHPEVFVVGDLASLTDEHGQAVPGCRAGRDAAGAAGRAQ